MNIKFISIICTYLTTYIYDGQSIRWLALQHANIQWNLTKSITKTTSKETQSLDYSCEIVRKYYGFSKSQTRLCRSIMDVMPHIQKATILASDTCKTVFGHRRWNCSSINLAPHFTPDLTRATREQAYVYAISSAALTYVMAQLCTSGLFYHCSCGNHPKNQPNGNFKWGGCGDNVKWGTRFSRRFIDSIEKRSSKKSVGRLKKQNSVISEKQFAVVNLHNNRVGRRVVSQSLRSQCQCHGVSGSCSIKTCWKSLPYITEIGKKLLRQYTTAIEVSVNYSDIHNKKLPQVPGRKWLSLDQLVYVTKSPDYCTKDVQHGSFGTVGRKCNITSTGTDSCSQLCCGRGYQMILEEKLERCHCKYYYCCYVRCKTCRTFIDVYECV